MPAPTEVQALEALQRVQSLTGPQLNQAITDQLGNPMLGLLDSLAKAALPDASKDMHHRAVHLMVLSFLMGAEIQKK